MGPVVTGAVAALWCCTPAPWHLSVRTPGLTAPEAIGRQCA